MPIYTVCLTVSAVCHGIQARRPRVCFVLMSLMEGGNTPNTLDNDPLTSLSSILFDCKGLVAFCFCSLSISATNEYQYSSSSFTTFSHKLLFEVAVFASTAPPPPVCVSCSVHLGITHSTHTHTYINQSQSNRKPSCSFLDARINTQLRHVPPFSSHSFVWVSVGIPAARSFSHSVCVSLFSCRHRQWEKKSTLLGVQLSSRIDLDHTHTSTEVNNSDCASWSEKKKTFNWPLDSPSLDIKCRQGI